MRLSFSELTLTDSLSCRIPRAGFTIYLVGAFVRKRHATGSTSPTTRLITSSSLASITWSTSKQMNVFKVTQINHAIYNCDTIALHLSRSGCERFKLALQTASGVANLCLICRNSWHACMSVVEYVPNAYVAVCRSFNRQRPYHFLITTQIWLLFLLRDEVEVQSIDR